MNRKREASLPGEDLIIQGLDDLMRGETTDNASLVLITAPRLRRMGMPIPNQPPRTQPYEHTLYERLEERLGASTHSRYNSLIRRVASYAAALEREQSRG